MDLDSFFGLEDIVKEILFLGNYDGHEALAIVFIHVFAAAVCFVIAVLTSPLKVLRPMFSWLGAIWIQLTLMAVFFIGLAFFITKGDISMARVFYLYSMLLALTIFMHYDSSRLMPKGLINMGSNNNGRIDFSFREKGKIPKRSGYNDH